MNQPASQHHSDTGPPPVTAATAGHLAAFGGVGFLVTSIAGDLMIGAFPRPDTPVGARLTSFYAAHHAQLLAGGWLFALSGAFFALFGTAMWARTRQAGRQPHARQPDHDRRRAGRRDDPREGAGTFGLLGSIGGQHAITPAALQAWHILRSSGGSLADSFSTFIFLLPAAACAGIMDRFAAPGAGLVRPGTGRAPSYCPISWASSSH